MSTVSPTSSAAAQERPGRVTRHKAVDRLIHWLSAICVLILLGTSFLPILGVEFAWVDIHWITGIVLCVLVLIHIVLSGFDTLDRTM